MARFHVQSSTVFMEPEGAIVEHFIQASTKSVQPLQRMHFVQWAKELHEVYVCGSFKISGPFQLTILSWHRVSQGLVEVACLKTHTQRIISNCPLAALGWKSIDKLIVF